jgi:hypothetical protein
MNPDRCISPGRAVRWCAFIVAIGAVLNTVATYALVAARCKLTPVRWIIAESPWSGLELKGLGRRRLLLEGYGTRGFLVPPGWVVSDEAPLPHWYTLPEEPARRVLTIAAVDLYGWPAPSLRCSTGDVFRGELRGAIRLADRRRSQRHNFVGYDAWSHYLVPYNVILMGFAANTLFYGTIGTSLLCAWRTLRRCHVRRRAHRGLCGACGYHVMDLQVCPECGKPMSHSSE